MLYWGHVFCECGREMIDLGYDFDTGDRVFLCTHDGHTVNYGSDM
jgi:hypothetical protein